MDSSKRIYRDSLFRAYFRDTENFTQLCNAVTGLNLKSDKLRELTVDEILFDSLRNDVSFSADGNYFVFFEHQSTRNFNMPLRMLFYLSLLYQSEVESDLIYRTKLVKLPAPKFFVFYNGKEFCPEESTLKLSDAFCVPGDIELTVKVFNINYNQKFRLIRECRPVHDYSCFVDMVESRRATGIGRDEAIITAMKWCIANDVMSEFLEAHMWEVFNMISLVWDEDAAKKFYTAEARAEGRMESLIDSVRNAMKNWHLTAEAAMNGLGISPEMQKKLAPLI